MKLISVAQSAGHTFLLYAPSADDLRKSLTHHGPAIAEQLVGDEKTIGDRFFRMKQAVFLSEAARKAE